MHNNFIWRKKPFATWGTFRPWHCLASPDQNKLQNATAFPNPWHWPSHFQVRNDNIP